MSEIGTIANGLGFFLLATLGFLLIGDGFFWDQRRLAIFSLVTVSFHQRHLGSHRTLGSVSSGDGLVESESDLFGSIFLLWYFFFLTENSRRMALIGIEMGLVWEYL